MQSRQQVGKSPMALVSALALLAACENTDAPDDKANPVRAPEITRLVPANEAISGADVATLDPMPMVDAEIRKVLGPSPYCEFRYTSEGRPVLAVREAANSDARDGAVKVNGDLVVLSRAPAEPGAVVLVAGRIRVSVTPEGGQLPGDARRREADVVFEIGDSLRVGYRGYYRCLE